MNTEKVISRDNDYILHTYGRSQVVLAEGEGMTARDADGKSYLDFTSGIGVNSLGYCHPAWVRAVADQAATLQHTSNLYYTAPDGKLAKKLCRRTGLDAVFFGNSGAEANEGAIKCARKYSVDTYGESRNKVITLVNSFHGRTLATLTATGQDVFHHDFGPFPGNFDYVPAGDFAALEKAADKDTCAVMMELVQGEGGVVALDADYVARVAAFCREKDILVIVDEVQTGVGRTGTFLCCEHYNLKPDIVTLAKGLGGGLPIGAVLMNEKSIIRKYLLQDDVCTANRLLSYPYTLHGNVVKGFQVGRKIGFPTANLNIDYPDKLIPANGVYAVRIGIPDGKHYGGMLNIGHRPTLNRPNDYSIEVNIFDFSEDLYGKTLSVELIEYVRTEKTFADIKALQSQLVKDKETIRKILSE